MDERKLRLIGQKPIAGSKAQFHPAAPSGCCSKAIDERCFAAQFKAIDIMRNSMNQEGRQSHGQ
jgi:hypothetical protein